MADTSLIAVAYDTTELAESALEVVRTLNDEDVLVIRDAAIVVKHDDGRVELRQSRRLSSEDGIASGGAIGLVLGLALAGALVGLAGGAGFSAPDQGFTDEHVRALGATIARGHAVLFALLAAVDWGRLRQGLAPFGGDVVASEVADDILPRLGATPA